MGDTNSDQAHWSTALFDFAGDFLPSADDSQLSTNDAYPRFFDAPDIGASTDFEGLDHDVGDDGALSLNAYLETENTYDLQNPYYQAQSSSAREGASDLPQDPAWGFPASGSRTEIPTAQGARSAAYNQVSDRRWSSTFIDLPGQSTRQEDSDRSWTEQDASEEWYSDVQTRLSDFRKDNQCVSAIIAPLGRRERRQIHAMSHIMSLSHLSLGDGKDKYTLITKCLLAGDSSLRRWNPSRETWMDGFIDPRIVEISGVSASMVFPAFQTFLRDKGLHLAQKLGRLQDAQCVGCAYFDNPVDALEAIKRLNNIQPDHINPDGKPLTCEYLVFPKSFENLQEKLAECAGDITEIVQEAWQIRRQEEVAGTTVEEPLPPRSQPGIPSIMQSHEQSLGHLTAHSVAERVLHDGNIHDSDTHSGSSSSGGLESNLESAYDSNFISSGSDGSSGSKRKPRIPQGYRCTYEGCGYVNNRDGDVKQHFRRVHGSKTHFCDVCKKGFAYPKDRKRHRLKVHAHSVEDGHSSASGH